MIESCFTLLMLTIATERITEILVASKLFDPLRNMIKRWAYPLDEMPTDTYYQNFKVMIDYLVTCGYCVSVWVGYLLAVLSPSVFNITVINWLVMGAVIHGLSNLYHCAFEIVRRGRVHTYDVLLKRRNDGE